MKMNHKHQFLYRVAGKKPNGRMKTHIKCSKNQAEAMANSWRKGRPGVTTMSGEVVDLPPMKVTVERSVRVVWPEEVPGIKADMLIRLADHLEDSLDWKEGDSDPDYLLGYRDVISKIIELAEEYRKEAGNDPEPETRTPGEDSPVG